MLSDYLIPGKWQAHYYVKTGNFFYGRVEARYIYNNPINCTSIIAINRNDEVYGHLKEIIYRIEFIDKACEPKFWFYNSKEGRDRDYDRALKFVGIVK